MNLGIPWYKSLVIALTAVRHHRGLLMFSKVLPPVFAAIDKALLAARFFPARSDSHPDWRAPSHFSVLLCNAHIVVIKRRMPTAS